MELCASTPLGYFIMTRLERKQAELDKLYEYRKTAMESNDFYWMQKSDEKIAALKQEIAQMKKEAAETVFDILSDKDESAKNEVYKALLRISLMADACNEACVVTRQLLSKYGVTDFSFRQKVDDLCKLSQDIASITIQCNNQTMEDFIVDNDTFVDMCMKHADAHIKRKLKI